MRIIFIIFSSLLFSVYGPGDTISDEHLNMTFDTCFGDISEVAFGDYQNNSVIWLNFAATWWGPCYQALQYGDEVYLDWQEDDRVQTFIVLDNIFPNNFGVYTCTQWASAGISSSEIISSPIIDDGSSPDQVIWNWIDWNIIDT